MNSMGIWCKFSRRELLGLSFSRFIAAAKNGETGSFQARRDVTWGSDGGHGFICEIRIPIPGSGGGG